MYPLIYSDISPLETSPPKFSLTKTWVLKSYIVGGKNNGNHDRDNGKGV